MSASQIPNLSTFRSSRSTGRGGRKFQGGPSATSDNGDVDEAAKDKIVQQTDQDASQSRASAVEIGYLEDAFTRLFLTAQASRRYPIINRGTYVRSTAIDALVVKFLSSGGSGPRQIVSLGAGSDTRFFRLVSVVPSASIIYHEIDFPANTAQKIATIQRQPLLASAIRSSLSAGEEFRINDEGTCLTSASYNLHPIDLRSLPDLLATSSSSTTPLIPNLSTSAPTLIISECCLCYLPPAAAEAVLRTLTTALIPSPTPVALVIYEPIRPNDSFGRVMIANLASRGIVLQTLKRYSSLGRQKERLRNSGFITGQSAADVDFIWENWVSEAEKERVAALEMMDEVEEWRLLARHYCVAWGWRAPEAGEADIFGSAWAGMQAQDELDDEV